ncbi:MAG: hypothetical protein ABDH66_04450 [Bacteroidia bacterium]
MPKVLHLPQDTDLDGSGRGRAGVCNRRGLGYEYDGMARTP